MLGSGDDCVFVLLSYSKRNHRTHLMINYHEAIALMRSRSARLPKQKAHDIL
jgi:hypothetical protein